MAQSMKEQISRLLAVSSDNGASESEHNAAVQQEIFLSVDRQASINKWRDNGRCHTVYELAMRIKDEPRPIIVYGAGRLLAYSLVRLEECRLFPLCICDSNLDKQGAVMHGLRVISTDELISKHLDDYILISTTDYYFSVRDFLTASGFPERNIFVIVFR